MKENKASSLDELRESLVKLSDIGSPDDTDEIGKIVGAIEIALESDRGINQDTTPKVRQVLKVLKDTGFVEPEIVDKYLARLDKQEDIIQVSEAIDQINRVNGNLPLTKRPVITAVESPAHAHQVQDTLKVAEKAEIIPSEFAEKYADRVRKKELAGKQVEQQEKKEEAREKTRKPASEVHLRAFGNRQKLKERPLAQKLLINVVLRPIAGVTTFGIFGVPAISLEGLIIDTSKSLFIPEIATAITIVSLWLSALWLGMVFFISAAIIFMNDEKR